MSIKLKMTSFILGAGFLCVTQVSAVQFGDKDFQGEKGAAIEAMYQKTCPAQVWEQQCGSVANLCDLKFQAVVAPFNSGEMHSQPALNYRARIKAGIIPTEADIRAVLRQVGQARSMVAWGKDVGYANNLLNNLSNILSPDSLAWERSHLASYAIWKEVRALPRQDRPHFLTYNEWTLDMACPFYKAPPGQKDQLAYFNEFALRRARAYEVVDLQAPNRNPIFFDPSEYDEWSVKASIAFVENILTPFLDMTRALESKYCERFNEEA